MRDCKRVTLRSYLNAVGILVLFFAAFSLQERAYAALQIADAADSAIPSDALISPESLVTVLKAAAGKPVILQVGSRVMFEQAHISGSEYIGPGSQPSGIKALHARLDSVSRDQSIVLYCGCCPWEKCPNVRPAYKELKAMGFQKVKVLYIADNFGTDWVNKGYPTEKR